MQLSYLAMVLEQLGSLHLAVHPLPVRCRWMGGKQLLWRLNSLGHLACLCLFCLTALHSADAHFGVCGWVRGCVVRIDPLPAK